MVMKTKSTLFKKESTGLKIKRLRIAGLLTQQELADMAGVTREQVDLFERNLPLPLDCKRRILRELWAVKFKK
jgi:transcriptional regulator with XRE-family HTH domain